MVWLNITVLESTCGGVTRRDAADLAPAHGAEDLSTPALRGHVLVDEDAINGDPDNRPTRDP
jgi:hypothetical protein